jgi:hypothetical protein
LPIPAFDESNATHVRMSRLGVAAEQIAAAFPVNPELHFAATRRHIRQLIDSTPEGREIDELVYELVS